MASISTLGVGSGLDLNTILAKIETAEKGVLAPISSQQSSYTARLSAYGSLKSALTAFQTANSALKNASLFTATSTSSSSSAFSATTSGSAIAGKYTISVSQLAQAQTLTSKAVQTDTKSAIASTNSVLTIAQGGGKKPIEIPVTAANSSLSGLRDTINNANAGVSASIINVGSGQYRLSITAKDTGADNAMTLSVKGDDALQNFIGYGADGNGGMSESVTAQNARLKVNNIDIENSSNTISDALEDITLNLNDVTSGNQTLTITKDTSKAEKTVSDWVTAYNALQDTFATLTKYTAAEKGAETQNSSNGALIGDSTLRTVQTQLKSILSNTASSSAVKSLSQLGITSDPGSGKLNVDSDTLKNMLSKDAPGAAALIVGDGKETGLTGAMDKNLSLWLSKTGIIQAATDGVSKTLNNLTAQYNAASDRVDSMMAGYKAQFTQLDVLMSSLNSISSYLTQQFDNLSSNKR